MSKAQGIKDNITTQLSAVNLSKTNKNDPLVKTDQKFQKPSFFSKLKFLFLKIRSPSKMSDKKPGRPMLYPYTFSAKIAQFPLKFYIKNNWMWRYYFIAIAVSFPIFYKIGRLSNSPENVKTWEEIRRRDFTPGGHH